MYISASGKKDLINVPSSIRYFWQLAHVLLPPTGMECITECLLGNLDHFPPFSLIFFTVYHDVFYCHLLFAVFTSASVCLPILNKVLFNPVCPNLSLDIIVSSLLFLAIHVISILLMLTSTSILFSWPPLQHYLPFRFL